MSIPCFICGSVALYYSGKHNYCKAHKTEAWSDRASTIHPAHNSHQPTTSRFFATATKKAKAQREAGYLNPARKPEKELGQ